VQRADSSPSEGTRVEIRSAYFGRTMSWNRGGDLAAILGPPTPRIKHIDIAEARRVDEIDAGRLAIELDRDGEVVDDLEERRRRSKESRNADIDSAHLTSKVPFWLPTLGLGRGKFTSLRIKSEPSSSCSSYNQTTPSHLAPRRWVRCK
jgi:hypothetical protein